MWESLDMEEHADFFIIAPGGIGTMDEFFEVLTLKYLNQGDKPIILFNVNGFFDDIVKVIERLVSDKFASERILDSYIACNTIEEVEKELQKELRKVS